MSRAKNSPQNRYFPYSRSDTAASNEADDERNFEEEHELQSPPSLHLLALLYFQLHAASVSRDYRCLYQVVSGGEEKQNDGQAVSVHGRFRA